MALDNYFRDELAFLKEQGKVFSEIHPQLSRFLNGRHSDPDVERLLEGFAFLTGKLREKVDDEFPELTHSIINMLWPNYLRPVPSLSILRFYPKNNFNTHQQIPTSTLIDSTQVQGTTCHFSTCRNVDIYPLQCTQIQASHSKEMSQISLTLTLLDESEFVQSTGLDSLRFYLGGEAYSAQYLYLWLGQYLESIEIVCDGAKMTVPVSAFQAVGFDDDGLLPYPSNVYQGYRLFQEYLAFPEAFHFFDLRHLGQYVPADIKGRFTIQMVFNQPLPSSVRVNNDSFILYATPIVNLFSHDADPIDLTGKKVEYPLVPSSRHARHYEIFSVDRVEGWQEASQGRVRGQQRLYSPFESFQHDIELARQRLALYYRVRIKESLSQEGVDHFMSFVRSDETVSYGQDESVSVSLTCTNRQLPAELAVGDICISTQHSPSFADFDNITRPTQALRPTLDGSLLWTLISNLSLNYLSLLNKEALISVLRAYDFRALVDKQAARTSRQRMEGILSISSKPSDKLFQGMPVRGVISTLMLDPNAFGSEGDLYLFGSVLSRFFALYASINSFHELVVINAESREEYRWGSQVGVQPLI